MDPLTALALQTVLTAAFLYALYWVIRKAVAAGRLERRRREELNDSSRAPLYRRSSS